MKNIKYIIIAFTALVFVACDNYVDITPKGNAIAETLLDVNQLLEHGNGLSSPETDIPTLINDNLKAKPEDISAVLGSSWGAEKGRMYNLLDAFYLTKDEDFHWSNYFSTIARANYIIQVLDEINDDSDEAKHYRGEAMVHRAFAYFLAVNIYGEHYGLSAASEAESGVPLVTVYGDNQASLVRSSVNEVYDFILTDLNTAVTLLREGSPSPDRPNKAAAQALMARVYLHMGNYEKALENANMALSFNSVIFNFNDIEPPVNWWESAVPPITLENPEYVLLKETYVPSAYLSSGNLVFGTFSDELVALYDKYDDQRISLIPGQDWVTGDYVYGLSNSWDLRHAVGVTTPELYLIKAEALARDAKITEALDLVNELRAHRYTTTAVEAGLHILEATTKEETIAHVIDERRREFHVNGMRFFDMKRLNAIENAGLSLTREGKTWGPNSINWACPIGPDVIETSDGQIKQNPRE